MAVLAAIGRRSTLVIALGVFVGLLVPPLAALLRPLLLPAILLPFVIALMRLELAALRRQAARPMTLSLATLWLLAGSPLLVALVVKPLALPPMIEAGMITTAACAPLMAAAALAMIIGLEVGLVLVLIVVATLLKPFTLPPLAFGLAGLEVPVEPLSLTVRLAVIVAGAFLVARLVRVRLGGDRLERWREALDGLAALGLVGFAIGVMDGFTRHLLAEPGYVLACIAAVFALNIGLQAVTAVLAWRSLGPPAALSLGLAAGNNNMGLVLAAMAEEAPFELIVFVAAAQFPIYLLPAAQKRLYRHWLLKGTG